jgi:Tol biopolymer transport system component
MQRMLWIGFTAVVAALVVLTGVLAPVGRAATILYVAPAGNDSNTCLDPTQACLTINGAIGKAIPGAAIRVAVGTYTATSGTEVVFIGKNITLDGGYDAAFAGATGVSTIDAQSTRRGVTVATGMTASVSRFTIENGSANEGSGIANGGNLTLRQTTVSNNSSAGSSTGGGLRAYTGSTTRVIDSTFSLNSALRGGAFYMDGGTLDVVDSTVTENHAAGIAGFTGDGGGIYILGEAQLQVSNGTIASNAADNEGGGIFLGGGYATQSATLRNTIVAGNASGLSNSTPDCRAASVTPVTSAGYNLIGSTSGCAFTSDPSDLIGGQAFMASPANNGGPTETMALQPASDAIDAGNPSGCTDDLSALLTTDQTGAPRTFGGKCDIGAYEAGAPENDNLASAQPLDPLSLSGSLEWGNRHATLQPNEPEHAGDEGGASVWFTWTPSFGSPAPAFVDTAGSAFDTLLGVYQMTSTGLARVGSNDDSTAADITSRLCFTATPGTEYLVAVDGYAGDTGLIHLSWGARGPGDSSPCPTMPPVVTGPAQVGTTLTSTNGSWDGNNATTVQRQWVRCQAELCRDVPGPAGTGSSYVITARDIGTSLRVDVQEADGGSPALSTSDPTAAVSGTAAAHPNGRIYWSTNRDALDYEIYSMYPDGTGILRVTNHAGFDVEPAVSPDGTKIAFVRGGHIAVMNADGSGVVDTGLSGAFPVWSPDGSRIAYASGAGSFSGVGIVDADGANQVTLFQDDPGTFYDLAWSPDGSKIAFTYQFTLHGHYNIGVVGADGRGGSTQLTNAATDDHSPTWSPDGSKLAFVRGAFTGTPAGDLYTMHADGTVQTLIHAGGANQVTSAVWSPDGTKILFSEFNAGNSDLWTILPNGTGLTRLTTDGNRDELPAWGAAATYTLTTARAGSGSGSISSSPAGIACGSTCTATFLEPTQVQLTATPASGSTFAGWSGACSGTESCSVTMLGAQNVSATFNTNPPPSGGGGGDGGGGGIPPDLTVTVTASAPNTPPVGSDVIFFVNVFTTNTGGSSDVLLTLTLPTGLTLNRVYADRGGCAGTAPNLICDVAWINPSTSTHVTLFGTVAQAGELDLTASVQSRVETELATANNTTTFKLMPVGSPPSGGGGGGSFSPPHALRPPIVLGKHKIGNTVQATLPDWDSTPARVTYQWQLCTGTRCVAIRGATKLTLKLLPTWAGRSVRIVATATTPGGSAKSTSKRFAVTRH